MPWAQDRSAGTAANVILCLVHQTNYLLDQLLRKLEAEFLEHGGFKENLYRARVARREAQRREQRQRCKHEEEEER